MHILDFQILLKAENGNVVRTQCGDLNQPPIFRAPPDHFYCCEWDPIFINVDFWTNELI